MESKAVLKFLRVAPRKARLVADEVRGKNVGVALNLLQHSINKRVSSDVYKLIASAVANIQNNNSDVSVNVDELRVKEIQVGSGPILKRFRPRSQGRAFSIYKRMCHISVTVSN